MRVTIKEVAKEAGVSTSTVSRVISKDKRISEETSEKVREVIKKLNYIPNIVARGLAKNKTRILAVVLPDGAEELFSNPFFVQAMRGISIYAQKENYYILYIFNNDLKKNNEKITEFIKSNLVDGICLFNAKDNDETIEYLKSENFPFVVIGRPEEIEETLWVDNDNFEAMYKLTQNLIDMGHEEIGFVGSRKELNMSKDRLNGYKQALYSRNIEINNNYIIERDYLSEEEGYIAGMELLKNNKISAIVTTDDLLAFGVQKVLLERKINNMALVGFNNIPLSRYKSPSIASVDINSEKLGFYATKLLIDNLEGRSNKSFYVIDTELIKRETFIFNKENY